MIQITLGDTQLPHITYEVDGAKRSFHVDHNTLFEFIQNNCCEVQEVDKGFTMPVFETPALPPNTVKYMALPDGKIVLFIEKKESKETIKYHSTTFDNVCFPNLLFVFEFVPAKKGYNLRAKKCFAFQDKVFRDTTQLYRFPFSHVQQNGDMCFFFMTELNDLAQMASYIHNWMAVSFTDHYYNEMDKNLWGAPLRQVFTELSKAVSFDYSKLIKEPFAAKDIALNFAKPYFPANN